MASSDGRLEKLLEAGRLLSAQLELGDLLKSVLRLAADVVGAESASLLLLDERTQELYFDTALGLEGKAAQARLPVGSGIAGTVAKSRKTEIVGDAARDPRWNATLDGISGFRTRNILAVPILVQGRLLGVLEALNRRGGDFDAEDARLLEAFAGQAGVAIENARLFTALREEKYRLTTVFSQMRDGVILAEEDGRVLLANEAARVLLDDTATVPDAFAGFDTTPPPAVLLSSRPVVEFIAVRREPTLLVITGQAAHAPLAGRAGRVLVFRDGTETWRQEGLKRSFLSLISHKLKTPLASVIGFSDVLDRELGPGSPPMALKAAKTIREQGAKVGELVDKLLRYTTLESPDTKVHFEPVVVDEAVAEALKAVGERLASRRARVDYKNTGHTVEADRFMLVESLKNLIENAVKFDPKDAPAVAVRVDRVGDWTAMSVSDVGPGIPPEEHDSVFRRFHQVERDFTGQKEGMGLGLAYVKKVAELHGGSVMLRSKLGHGTTVTLTLPVKKAA